MLPGPDGPRTTQGARAGQHSAARSRDRSGSLGQPAEVEFAISAAIMRSLDLRRTEETLGSASHPAYYLAIPPSLFTNVVESLAKSSDGECRVIRASPLDRSHLGVDVECCSPCRASGIENLSDRPLLGKEAVLNLLFLASPTTSWSRSGNRNYIESVQITMAEKFGIEGRGNSTMTLGRSATWSRTTCSRS